MAKKVKKNKKNSTPFGTIKKVSLQDLSEIKAYAPGGTTVGGTTPTTYGETTHHIPAYYC